MNLYDKYEKNRNVINSCYYRKKKINYCNGFMPGNIQIICSSMTGKNGQSPASIETPVYGKKAWHGVL